MATFLITADDAGASEDVNRSIENSVRYGSVNSVSFLPNCASFTDATQRFSRQKFPQLRRSVHLNLSEGPPLSQHLPILAPNGYFVMSSAQIARKFVVSSPVRRSAIAAEIAEEFELQLSYFADTFGFSGSINVDSHQHVHMWPFAFSALLRVLAEKHFKRVSMRLPRERGAYITPRGILRGEPPLAGILKTLVLRNLSIRNQASLQDFSEVTGISVSFPSAFCGVTYTGCMSLEVVKKFVVSVVSDHELASPPEILLHPGGGTDGGAAWQANPGLASFYGDSNRLRERRLAQSPELAALLFQN